MPALQKKVTAKNRAIGLIKTTKGGQHLLASLAERRNAVKTGRKFRPRIFLYGNKIRKRTITKSTKRWEGRIRDHESARRKLETFDKVLYKKEGGMHSPLSQHVAARLFSKQLVAKAKKMGVSDRGVRLLSELLVPGEALIPGTKVPIRPSRNITLIKIINELGYEETKKVFDLFTSEGNKLFKTASLKKVNSGAFRNAVGNGPAHIYGQILSYLPKEKIAHAAWMALAERTKDLTAINKSSIENKEYFEGKISTELAHGVSELIHYLQKFKIDKEAIV